VDKEALALQLARQHRLTQGPIAVLTCQENARTYRTRGVGNGLVAPLSQKTRCLHYYHYFLHHEFGLCYVRIQSWFPFSVRVCLSGRRGLAQHFRTRDVGVQERGTLITAVDDPALAQRLLRQHPHAPWIELLSDLVRPVPPLWDYLPGDAVRTP